MVNTVNFAMNINPASGITATTVTAGQQDSEIGTPVSQTKDESEKLYFGAASGTAPQNHVFPNHWRTFERRD